MMKCHFYPLTPQVRFFFPIPFYYFFSLLFFPLRPKDCQILPTSGAPVGHTSSRWSWSLSGQGFPRWPWSLLAPAMELEGAGVRVAGRKARAVLRCHNGRRAQAGRCSPMLALELQWFELQADP
ncbi:hypothetical protein SETIT_1G028600v2 [Setaria italica]|uniref:Uncharacterized protein n=1 Tax=Setaria italica TaxID=4555 RepID=A0A368PGJ6_SETIT|nr:hypothetical protein SETIT_1G028600v2 [Setaria italica]